jgi:hypothetical protein
MHPAEHALDFVGRGDPTGAVGDLEPDRQHRGIVPP